MRASWTTLGLAGLMVLVPAAMPAGGHGSHLPSEVGAWDPAILQGEVPAVSMALLKDGRVLYWSGVEAGHDGHAEHEDQLFFLGHPHEADWRVLDLAAADKVKSAADLGVSADTAGDLFCAGHTLLPDGRVLAVGGTDYTSIPEAGGWDILYGTARSRAFDPATNTWTATSAMAHGRWYPSVLQVDDDALVASGVETLTNPNTMQTEVERFDAASGTWSAAGERLLPMYPRLSEVPSGPLKGKVFYSTNGALWGPFGWHPGEAQWSLQQVYDPAAPLAERWSFLGPSVFGARQHAASVLLPLGPDDGYRARILTFGGTLQRSVLATGLAEVADLGDGDESPSNAPAASLALPRWHLNGVLLPDGKVLAVGGGLYDNVIVHGQPNVPVLEAELYDPASDAWTPTPAMQVPRMYHSTALLLPDGRVLVGGHVPLPVPWKQAREDPTLSSTPFSQEQVRETRLEIYEPPYLFRGARPAIVGAPAAMGYGPATYTVTVDVAAADVDSVVLVHPGATTHSYDSSQRLVELPILARSGSALTVGAPPDADVAPPGDYMLFVTKAHAQGPVPSAASWVHVA